MSKVCTAPRRVQCKACPWKKTTVPERDIPNGYKVELHRKLKVTVHEGLASLYAPSMACHESKPGKEIECVGWVIQQLGSGNNIGLRMRAMDGRYNGWKTVGPQHERFEDTLPKKRSR